MQYGKRYSEEVDYFGEKARVARETWLSNVRLNVKECGTLALITDNKGEYPRLSLRDEDGEEHIVNFSQVRTGTRWLEFRVSQGGGFCEDGEWLSEIEFPNAEWMRLIQDIGWPDLVSPTP